MAQGVAAVRCEGLKVFLHVGGVHHANDGLLEEIDNCPGRGAATEHLKKRKERLGMQPPPVDHEQWVSYTGREFESMNGGQAESMSVILEVGARSTLRSGSEPGNGRRERLGFRSRIPRTTI